MELAPAPAKPHMFLHNAVPGACPLPHAKECAADALQSLSTEEITDAQ
jgi:hypothetical protein